MKDDVSSVYAVNFEHMLYNTEYKGSAVLVFNTSDLKGSDIDVISDMIYETYLELEKCITEKCADTRFTAYPFKGRIFDSLSTTLKLEDVFKNWYKLDFSEKIYAIAEVYTNVFDFTLAKRQKPYVISDEIGIRSTEKEKETLWEEKGDNPDEIRSVFVYNDKDGGVFVERDKTEKDWGWKNYYTPSMVRWADFPMVNRGDDLIYHYREDGRAVKMENIKECIHFDKDETAFFKENIPLKFYERHVSKVLKDTIHKIHKGADLKDAWETSLAEEMYKERG